MKQVAELTELAQLTQSAKANTELNWIAFGRRPGVSVGATGMAEGTQMKIQAHARRLASSTSSATTTTTMTTTTTATTTTTTSGDCNFRFRSDSTEGSQSRLIIKPLDYTTTATTTPTTTTTAGLPTFTFRLCLASIHLICCATKTFTWLDSTSSGRQRSLAALDER